MTVDLSVIGMWLLFAFAVAAIWLAAGCMQKAKKAIEAGPAFVGMAYYWLARAAIWVVVWAVLCIDSALRH